MKSFGLADKAKNSNLLHRRVKQNGCAAGDTPVSVYYHENQFISTNLGRIKSPV